MKHRTMTIVLATGLLLFLMAWSFGSLAANDGKQTAQRNPNPTESSNAITQGGEEDESDDPDLGKWSSRSKRDRDNYLRLRDEYIARKRGIEPGLPFDPEARGRAIRQMEQQEGLIAEAAKGPLSRLFDYVGITSPTASTTVWTSIGPNPISNGSALGGGETAVSGRVTSLVVDPTNVNNVYLGTAQGGVWRSLDGGTTWTAIADNAQSLAIGALALAPSNPSILYVGTGEFNACGDCFFGVGLYRIDNANTTPTVVGPINPSQTVGNLTYPIFNGRSITKILVHPTDPATIFVSTARGIGGMGASALGLVPTLATRGLWRSTNATSSAPTFQKVVVTTDNSPDSPATGNVDTTDIVMEPGVPNNLLIAVIGASTGGGIYRTTNALAGTPTFTQVFAAASGVRLQLTINKVGSVVTAYAATSETPNNTPGCTSSGTGAVRKQVDPFNSQNTWSTQLTGGGGFCGGQCFYNIVIGVNPTNANEVYLGGDLRGSCSDGMKKSINGGATFFRDDTGTHADSHALFFDGAGNVYAGNDGGVWKKPANNTSASPWTNLNKGALNTLQFYSIALHPTDRNLMIGGTQDNGTEYQQGSVGNWSNAETGDGGYCLIDQSATNTTNVNMYHTFYNVTGDQIGFDRAVDTTCLPIRNYWPTRGVGFNPAAGDPEVPDLSCDGTANYLHNGLNLTDNVLFYAPMALGPGTPNTVYFGTDRLYRSTNRGDTMSVVSQASISSPGSNGSPISTIAVWPGSDNLRMVGLQNGQVWATATGSATLVNLTSGSFPANPTGSLTNKFVGRAVIDPNNSNVAYIAFSFFAPAGQGVWKITNLVAASGTSPAAPVWTAAGNGIPSVPINGLVIDPANSNNIYAGTDIGVYVSTDGGANWSPFGTGLPRSAVLDLAIQNPHRILRAATHGRGIWEISIGASPWQPTTLTSAQAEIKTWTLQGRTYAYLKLLFPDAGYRVASWGQPVRSVNDFAPDAVVEKLNGASAQVVTTTAQIYDLGPLADGNYTFTYKNSGTVVKSQAFTVSSATPPPNPIDDQRQFVRQQYLDFLNREPDGPGWDFWTDNITKCSDPARRPSGQTEAQCTLRQRETTSGAFFLSPEFQYTGYYVYRMYQGALGRQPKLSEFTPDAQFVGAGIVINNQLSGAKINQNKVDFAAQFVNCTDAAKYRCAEFKAIYDGLNNPAYVDKLFLTTGVNASVADRTALINGLNGGTESRASVLQKVVDGINVISEGNQQFTTTYGQAFYNSEFNRAFVQLEYLGYLKRDPDEAGYNFWLAKLNQYGGNFVNSEMVLAFILSPEYRSRFGQP